MQESFNSGDRALTRCRSHKDNIKEKPFCPIYEDFASKEF